jgi:FkbM family methyltransferase
VLVGIPLRLLPTGTRARLKSWLMPTVRLDYPRAVVRLHADSVIELRRAKACRKEPETVEWIEKNMRPGDVLYDVGANVGAYSLVAAMHCGKRADIYAFEPSFATYYQLCRNILLNQCEDVILPYMIALAEDSGVTAFNYQSLEAGSSLHSVGANRDYKGDTFSPCFRQRVIGFSVDHLIAAFGFAVPNHLKVDVDGTEMEVLRGASATLRNPAVRSLLVEVCDANGQADLVTAFLLERGFVLASRWNRGGGPFWNYIFERAAGA